jgi:hypothetical protein
MFGQPKLKHGPLEPAVIEKLRASDIGRVGADDIQPFVAIHSYAGAAMMEVQHARSARRVLEISSKQVFLKPIISVDAACFISFGIAAQLGAPVDDFSEVDPLPFAKLLIFESCKSINAPQPSQIRAQFTSFVSLSKVVCNFFDGAVKSSREFDCQFG